MNAAFEKLTQFDTVTRALSSLADRSAWDQETVMPKGASEQRAEEVAAIQEVIHSRRTDPRIGEWLEGAEVENEVDQASLRIIRNDYNNYIKIPIDLAVEIGRLSSEAHNVWLEARKNNQFSIFRSSLKTMVSLKREEGQALNEYNAYEGLLEKFEPGIKFNNIEKMFERMRPRLINLRKRVLESGIVTKPLGMDFDEKKQMKLAKELAQVFGLDFNRSRIDKAVHPFSSGTGSDVRLTTRTSIHDPFNCIYSTIHEVGHAAYEQGIDRVHYLTPLGSGVSLGVHESQSRIYENQIGRSRAFTGWLFGRMCDLFSDFGVQDADHFYKVVNRVNDGFIRTEADELQYNLHIMLRFDLERALMSGDLQVDDLEVAWNDRFKADFGYDIDKPSNGILQDVHWSVGLIGYFPTYSLGNVYAGCLHEAMRKALPDLDSDLARGDTRKATGWLRTHVQQYGGLYEPLETIENAAGMAASEKPLDVR